MASPCAPGLRDLTAYAKRQFGAGVFLGCGGDGNHCTAEGRGRGYHCSKPLAAKDPGYSWRNQRDQPQGYAAAVDLKMSFPRSRYWLAWLVDQCKRGAFPAVCEIIGSLDGETVLYWRGPKFTTQRYTGNGHLTWTHVAVWRDTYHRDHTDLLKLWVDGQPAPPVPPAPPSGSTRPQLAYGSSAFPQLVQQVQTAVGCRVDGDFGPMTRAAVKLYQRGNMVSVDGIVGPTTWRLIDAGNRRRYRPILRQGSSGLDVRTLQQLLAVAVDGQYGPVTRRAVLARQKSERIPQDGICGPVTWAAVLT